MKIYSFKHHASIIRPESFPFLLIAKFDFVVYVYQYDLFGNYYTHHPPPITRAAIIMESGYEKGAEVEIFTRLHSRNVRVVYFRPIK